MAANSSPASSRSDAVGARLRIGLTGGIGSGKSTVADLFARLGAVVLDTDQIAREIVEPGQPALSQLVAALGNGILGPDGKAVDEYGCNPARKCYKPL